MKKVDYRYIFLILILIFGFYLRVYHIDYPVVGYHNWKETHYLTEGRNFAEFGFFEDGFFVPRWNYPTLNDHSTGIHTDSFPLTSIILGGLFKIFGNNLTLARMISVLFSIGTILIIFLIIKKLFKRYDLAIISAFIFAINPLGVFFGRQVQLLSYSLFFCLLGILYYLKWIKNPSWKNTFLFSIPLILGILTKYSFVLFVFPILMTYPYRNLKSKKYLDKNIFFIFLGILSLIWFKYSSSISQEISEQFKIIDFGVLINLEFWSILYLFAKDNYTLIGTLFFILGVFFWFFIVNLNRKSFPYKFFSFYLIGSVIWFVFMSQKLQGHNYHQYPLLLLFVFFVSLSIISLATFISKLFDIKKLKNLLILICLLLLLNSSIESKNRMFDTQFVGLDVAGEYLINHKLPSERVMHSSHQAYGLLWHGDIMGTKGIPDSVEKMEYARSELNANWLFVYNWDLNILQETNPLGIYIRDNYELKQFGFKIENDTLIPIYFLMKYGGSFSEEKINSNLHNQEIQEKKYEFSNREEVLNYINLE